MLISAINAVAAPFDTPALVVCCASELVLVAVEFPLLALLAWEVVLSVLADLVAEYSVPLLALVVTTAAVDVAADALDLPEASETAEVNESVPLMVVETAAAVSCTCFKLRKLVGATVLVEVEATVVVEPALVVEPSALITLMLS